MKVATVSAIRAMDKYCIEELKIPGIVLMENAALKVLKHINPLHQHFVVICGCGNNGGDGFALARHLYVEKKLLEVFLIGSEEKMSEDCMANYLILKNMGIKVVRISNLEDMNELREALDRCETAVDAIFGTGLIRELEGIYASAISIINENSHYILSIDVPSGFHSDKGMPLGTCIRANKTVSLQLYKKGFLAYGSDKYTGEIVVEDIGIPEAVIARYEEKLYILSDAMVKTVILPREKYSYKGDYGRVLVFAGSKGFTGAAYLTANSAVRSGSGLVTLCCKEELMKVMAIKLTEAMTVSLEDKERLLSLINRCEAVAFGPGMGDSEDTYDYLKLVLENTSVPVVIDADGINVLAHHSEAFKLLRGRAVLTPHMGEMARLTGLSIDYIRGNRLEVAADFAKSHGVITLLKGYNTVISDGENTIINPTGNSAMASGGMGDCLTGIIVSLLGQGYEPLRAAALAAYIHGRSGEKLSKEMFCVNATHVMEELPYTMREIQM